MGFNKKFFQTGGIVASSPAATAFNAYENFGTVLYTGNGGTQSIGGNNVRLVLSDSGGHTMVASIRTLDSEFTQTKPTGYTEWGSDLTAFIGAYGGSSTLSNGNKTVTTNTGYYNGGYTNNNYSSGKYYAEIVQNSSTDTNDRELIVGIITGTSGLANLDWRYSNVAYYSDTGQIVRDNTDTISANTFVSNDVIGVACDLDAGLVEIFKNGTSQGTIAISKEPLNFQPDLVWAKSRNGANNHNLYDSIRGATYRIFSHLTNAQDNLGTLVSFDSNGFTLSGNGDINQNYTYVAWCWKAGGAAVSNTNGSITSQVSANQAAGFSIVKYTGGGTGTQTVGHGLSASPELVIIKNLTDAEQWIIWHKDFTTSEYLQFTSTAKQSFSNIWGGTPSSSVIYVGSDRWGTMSGSSKNYISYNFHSVDGYQKVGSYNGNNSSQSITTGFKPRFILFKAYNQIDNWVILDSQRVVDNRLYPDLSNFEDSLANKVTFDTNGFTLTSATYNQSNYNFIYLAIA